MQIAFYPGIAVATIGLTKSQLTGKYEKSDSQGSCMAQYTEIIRHVTKLSKDMEGLYNAPSTNIRDVVKNESKYEMFYIKRTWIDADIQCFHRGGHLVSFEDLDELKYVSGLITKPCRVTAYGYGFWTAARDLGNNQWIWRNSGDPISGDTWDFTEPNNSGDCGTFLLRTIYIYLVTLHVPSTIVTFVKCKKCVTQRHAI